MVAGAAMFVFMTVTRGTAKIVERIFFVFCFVYIAYVISAFIVHPNWNDVLRQTLVPHFQASKAYIIMIIAVIGTTISPWMQFYIQAAVVDKGIREDDYKLLAARRRDGRRSGPTSSRTSSSFRAPQRSTCTIFMPRTRLVVNDVGDVAVGACRRIAGKFAALLFALGPAQRCRLHRLDLAALDGILRLRGFWIRTRHRSPVPRGADLLFVLPRAHRHWSRRRHLAGRASTGHHLLLAGAQRHAPPDRSRPDVAAHQ